MKKLIALDLPGGASWLAELQRAWDAGDAVFPLARGLPGAAAERLLREAGAGVIATERGRATTDFGRPVEEGDALVVATSGTSGEPRGVVLTHEAVEAAAAATSKRLAVTAAADRWLACLPLSHVGGLGVVTRALHSGTPLEIHPGFDAEAVSRAAAEGATLVSLVQTALDRIDPTLFRTILVGGSAVREARPPNVVATYGLTESGGGVVYDGVPLDGVEIEIRDDEIHLRGSMLLRAYRDGTNPKDSGWLATGDAGRIEDGVLVVDGRRDDMITTGGEKVFPAPIEAALKTVSGVAEVAVTGRPDSEWGEAVTAIVVPTDRNEPPQLEDLQEAVRADLPSFAAPKRLEIVSHLPRTPLGKVRRSQL